MCYVIQFNPYFDQVYTKMPCVVMSVLSNSLVVLAIPYAIARQSAFYVLAKKSYKQNWESKGIWKYVDGINEWIIDRFGLAKDLQYQKNPLRNRLYTIGLVAFVFFLFLFTLESWLLDGITLNDYPAAGSPLCSCRAK